MSDGEGCSNCKYYDDHEGQCRRRAPVQSGRLDFYVGEQLRAIAWALHSIASLPTPDDNDDLMIDATDAYQRGTWPDVHEDNWCGEYEALIP